MPTDESTNGAASRDGTTRRRALQYLSGGTLAASLGVAGCVQEADDGGDGGGDDGGDDGDSSDADGSGDDGTSTDGGSTIGTVTVGVLVPESGPSAPLGQAQRQGAERGVAFVNDSDAFDFEIEPVYEDTQTDPPTGRQQAEKVVEEDGAGFVVGALESSVGLAVADFASGGDLVYMSGAAAVEITGEDCNASTFRYESNAAQHMAGLTGFAARELGTKWWLHSTDEAYGQSAFEQIERRIDAQGLDVEVVGRTMPDFGTENYGPQISQISNSEAEVLAIPETGADLINFMKQAESAGLKDEVEIIGTALFAQVSRAALGATAVGTYSSVLYNHQLETGDNRQFVDAYAGEYDAPPGNFARVGYELVRSAARGIQAAGTSDPGEVGSALEDLQMTTVLGETSYRACDHQAVNPVWTGRIAEADEGTAVELIEKVEGPDTVRPCEETGCSL
jgi:branched-chain amino acid transport system substrate-binding protein